MSSGDMIVSLVPMRAWESDERKGEDGMRIPSGQPVLVIDAWTVGKRLRLRVIYDDRIVVFSCPLRVACRNWKLTCEG